MNRSRSCWAINVPNYYPTAMRNAFGLDGAAIYDIILLCYYNIILLYLLFTAYKTSPPVLHPRNFANGTYMR